ncbi:hypothetical protein FGG90_07650 [Clavibacter tessellarius]|nr:hypothetical protein [Clavibacter michiganensis]MBT1636333.1 hypothetical protein [Clavibacter michiganensis]UKF33889.1 hypothetical protein FGG90_07650 [Clavibacter michiganensis subsp. tessellarius]
MRNATRAAAMMPAALLTIGLGVTGAVMGPATAAHAQPNYRVCGVYNSATGGNYGTGLVAKIYKDDENNETCSQKLDFMRAYYDQAYPTSSGRLSFVMVTCELFDTRVGAEGGSDLCRDMDVNLIYKYTSKYDAKYPGDAGISFWHR